MTLFAGLSAFPVTPADGEGRVDTDHLGRLVARLAGAGVASIGVLGSTGGYVYLTRAERARAVAAAVEAAGDVPVLAGIGALRTSDVLRHARDAEAAGAQGVLLAPVSYLPLTDDDVAGLVADVAGATGLPICIYNNPGTTHFAISEALLARLAQIAGVTGVKNPPPPDRAFGAQIARVRASTPAGFSVGYSGDAAIAGALQGGADAWYSVLAGTCPDLCLGLWQAREDAVALPALNSRLAPLWALFDAHGSIRVVYEMANILDLGPVALPKPLLPMPAPVRDQIAAALDSVMGVSA
ncbi:MAG: dihydrodipicolinate synthase family protein [Pseudomonadota bacterium]